MPFKAKAACRRHIPKQRHRVTNWAEYDAGLRARGSLTVWFTPEAVAAWAAAPRTSRGGQPSYSDLAIATALTLEAVFRLALRQTEGLIGSILQLLDLDLAVPDHSTLSRRAETLKLPKPRSASAAGRCTCWWTALVYALRPGRVADGEARHQAAPGLESAASCDGRRYRPDRRLGADRQGCRRRLPGRSPARPSGWPVASFTGDGAYDRDDVYAEVAARHPDAAVIVPPRANAVPSDTAETAPTQRDRHLRCIAERGRMGWQKASGYNWRALVEADISRWKRVIGDGLRSQTDGRQATEVAIAADVLNRMLELGRPEYVRIA